MRTPRLLSGPQQKCSLASYASSPLHAFGSCIGPRTSPPVPMNRKRLPTALTLARAVGGGPAELEVVANELVATLCAQDGRRCLGLFVSPPHFQLRISGMS